MAFEPARAARFIRHGAGAEESAAAYLSAALRDVLSVSGAGLRGRVRADGRGFVLRFERGGRRHEANLPADVLHRRRRARPAALEALCRATADAVRALASAVPEAALPPAGIEAVLGLRALAATLSAIEARGGRVLPAAHVVREIFFFGAAVAAFFAGGRLGLPLRAVFPLSLAILFSPILLRPRDLRVRTAAGEVLRIADRIAGTAYSMTLTGPGGPRALRLDLSGMRVDEDSSRLAALAGEAVDAVGLGR